MKGLTDRVLDTLHGSGHQATFFVVGKRAEQNPTLLKRMVESGSEVGNHTYSHARLSKLSQAEIAQQFQRTEEAIRSILGVTPSFVRPPFGELSARFILYLARSRSTSIGWSAHLGGDESIEDWSVSRILEQFAADQIVAGDVILMHDTNENVVAALPALLEAFERHNLRSVTLSALLDATA
jgi:peptidoglycan/xylan/chitin deacetylase (PgdA/CDA1 family)